MQNIKVEDADGYKIPSEKEFQRYMIKKEQPELIVICATPDIIPVPLTSFVGNEDGDETQMVPNTAPVPETPQTTEINDVTATDGISVIVKDKSKVIFFCFIS